MSNIEHQAPPEVGKKDSLETSKQTEEIRAILEEIRVYFSKSRDEIQKDLEQKRKKADQFAEELRDATHGISEIHLTSEEKLEKHQHLLKDAECLLKKHEVELPDLNLLFAEFQAYFQEPKTYKKNLYQKTKSAFHPDPTDTPKRFDQFEQTYKLAQDQNIDISSYYTLFTEIRKQYYLSILELFLNKTVTNKIPSDRTQCYALIKKLEFFGVNCEDYKKKLDRPIY